MVAEPDETVAVSLIELDHCDAEVEVVTDEATAEVGFGVGAAAGEAEISETDGFESTTA